MIENYNMENKITVFPKVTIYKNLLKDFDGVLEFVKESESYKEQKYIFGPWSEWNGNWSGSAQEVNTPIYQFNNPEDPEYVRQKDLYDKIYEAYYFAYKDYLKEYARDGIWPDYIKNWDYEDSDSWSISGMTYLKYDYDVEDHKKHDPKNGKYHLAMNYHSDTNFANLAAPEAKLTVTVTFYLNDDYEGGEICFYDGPNNKVYKYKPKAGDVTVFPSFVPYYHGVLPFDRGSRYLIRMFVFYKHPGDPEWFENQKKYGAIEWAKMEKERLHKGWEEGTNNMRIIMPGDLPDQVNWKKSFVDTDYIEVK